MHEPSTTGEVVAVVAAALQDGAKLEPRGGGTRAAVGAPTVQDGQALSLARLRGVVAYDPAELVLTARAGTPLAEVQSAVAEKGQGLAFEPWGAAASTLGGMTASGESGSRRVSAGAVRDHLLGFEAVSGRGERFIGGGNVVKNVTGYDLPKLMCGSWGRLAVLTELTFKVLPSPPERLTLAWRGLSVATAFELMGHALRLPADAAAAAALPEQDLTLVRLEGFGPSVAARARLLRERLARFGAPDDLADQAARDAWAALQGGAAFGEAQTLWRISLPRREGAAVAAALGGRWMADWAGGLIWCADAADAQAVRRVAAAAGGHATLMHAPQDLRTRIPALHPLSPGVAALSERVRRAFDPKGVFETGRFLDADHAD